MTKNRKLHLACLIGATLLIAACGDTRGERALSGAGIGAGVGALGGAVTGGDPITGAVIGGVVGGATGAVTDKDDIDLSR